MRSTIASGHRFYENPDSWHRPDIPEAAPKPAHWCVIAGEERHMRIPVRDFQCNKPVSFFADAQAQSPLPDATAAMVGVKRVEVSPGEYPRKN